jgi:CHASE3 domain sensor protein
MQLNVSSVIAGLFIFCMVVLSVAFCAFLLEILVATRVVRATLMHAASFRNAKDDASTVE